MAVEARHMSLFPPQILSNCREIIDQGNGNVYNGGPTGFGFGIGMMAPLSGTTTTETFVPLYGPGVIDSVPKADSGLTYSLPLSRKRSRESSSFNPLLSIPNVEKSQHGPFTFLGEDISMQIHQQQLEIDRFIAHHTEKVRLEIEETRKRNSRRLIAAAEDGIMKRLRAKEEETVKIGKLNFALEEKVKSLCVENQIWRELAQTNEATANALRSNLEQVLAQVQQDQEQQQQRGLANEGVSAALIEDAQSCCGSNYEEHQDQRTLAEGGGGGEKKVNCVEDHCTSASTSSHRWCRNCGKGESCVLLLPCRHLCICTGCAPSINVCPICKSTKNASVHVNMN